MAGGLHGRPSKCLVSLPAGQSVIEQLRQFLDIDDDARRLGQKVWQVVAPSIDPVLDEFYRKVAEAGIEPQLSDTAVRRLKLKQKVHWASLFHSEFDEQYVRGTQRMGIQHRDVGLSLSHYISAYMVLKIEFANVIVRAALPVLTKGLLIKTLDKYVALDMALALSVYEAAVID